MALTEQEIKAIAAETADQLAARERAFFVDPETHYKDHLFLEQLRANQEIWEKVRQWVEVEMNERNDRQLDARKIRNQVVGALLAGGVILALGVLGSWAVRAMGDFVRDLIRTQGG